AARRPPSWAVSATLITTTPAPPRASDAAAYSASPPLLPAPTIATTDFPSSAPPSRTDATAARLEAARDISSPSSSVAIAAVSASRTADTAYARIIGASALGDDDG